MGRVVSWPASGWGADIADAGDDPVISIEVKLTINADIQLLRIGGFLSRRPAGGYVAMISRLEGLTLSC
ncbi:hypothetical protein GCM10023195_77560 [Actinoallomurus liliacearum]|uniref:Uncharacterized protein n=1 Tax=Actinoallomurus liliacearum TaxID=1080073 RepID=A0ABP8TZ23_9ACTN